MIFVDISIYLYFQTYSIIRMKRQLWFIHTGRFIEYIKYPQLLGIWAIFKIVISYSKNKGSCGRVSANRLRDLQTYISFLSRFKLFHLCFKKNNFLSLSLSQYPLFHVPLFVYTPSLYLWNLVSLLLTSELPLLYSLFIHTPGLYHMAI